MRTRVISAATVVTALIAGMGISGASVAAAATAPGAPTITQALGQLKAASVTWAPPVDNGGDPISNYFVAYSMDDSTWSADISDDDTTMVIPGLSGGQTYFFRVKAQNSAGQSVWSPSVSAVALDVPVAPTNIVASPSRTSVSLSWPAPSSTGGSAITGYEYAVVKDDTTPAWGASTTTVNLAGTVSGLSPATAYLARVRAINSVGASAWISAKFTTASLAAPAAPGNLSVATSTTSATATWVAPADDGGSPVVRYELALSSDDSTWTGLPNTTQVTASLTGLTPGQGYFLRARAVNSIGAGAWTKVAFTANALQQPAAPTAVTAAASATGVLVRWTAPANNGGSAITRYEVSYSPDNTNWVLESAGTNTSLNVIGMAANTAHQVRVRAVNAVGNGAWSSVATVTPVGTPGAPTGLAVKAATAPQGTVGSAVTLSWVAPTNTGGSPITRYEYTYSSDAQDVPQVLATTTLNATVTGLEPGVSYSYRVRAVTTIGKSAWVEVTSQVPAAAPSAPRNVTASLEGSGVKLAWQAPASTGGTSVTGYKVEAIDNAGKTVTVTSSSTSVTVSSLTMGGAYTFRVAAVNSVGQGSWSATTSPVVVYLAPSAPTGLRVTPLGDTGIVDLSWTSPTSNGGLAIKGYLVQWTADNSDATRVFVVRTGTSAVVQVPAAGSYKFSVVAFHEFAFSSSAETSFMNVSVKGDTVAPTGVKVSRARNVLSVSWVGEASQFVVTVTVGGKVVKKVVTAKNAAKVNIPAAAKSGQVRVGALDETGRIIWAAPVKLASRG